MAGATVRRCPYCKQEYRRTNFMLRVKPWDRQTGPGGHLLDDTHLRACARAEEDRRKGTKGGV